MLMVQTEHSIQDVEMLILHTALLKGRRMRLISRSDESQYSANLLASLKVVFWHGTYLSYDISSND
jgi:hypothetical protein